MQPLVTDCGEPNRVGRNSNGYFEQTDSSENDFLFPTATVVVDTSHLLPRSVSKALEKICFSLDIKGVSMHCFRRTLATRMGDKDVASEVISRILNYAPRDVTSRHYDHARVMTQIREAMETWESDISRLDKGRRRMRCT